jgi:putative ABC transport system permease protein
MAIRSAMGAGRGRIIGQLITESTVLALAGGTAGLFLALWGVDLLKSFLPPDFMRFMPGWENIGIDTRVLAFTLILSVLTGIVFGLAPALQASRPDLVESLKEGGGKSSDGLKRNRLRSMLVVSEIALSLMLVLVSALLIKSFGRLMDVNPGFRTENILKMNMTLPSARYREPERIVNFHNELLQRVESLPGVESAATINHLPLDGSNSTYSLLVEGKPELPPHERIDISHRSISSRYFETMDIPVIQGRGFTEQYTAKTTLVIILNNHLAGLLFPGEDPVGKRVRFPGPAERRPWMLIVGVSGDVKHTLGEPVKPEMYIPRMQDPWSSGVLVVRTKSDPMALAAAVRGEVQAIDKDQPVYEVMTMEQVRARGVMIQRFSVTLLGVFAALALVLAGVGIYGVMSYSVSRRTHEIGIRMALGARQGDVLRMVLRQALKLTLSGVAIGLGAAFALTRFMSSLLFGVSPTDPVIFVSISLLLIAVSLFASFVPARKAIKVDPMIALRYE